MSAVTALENLMSQGRSNWRCPLIGLENFCENSSSERLWAGFVKQCYHSLSCILCCAAFGNTQACRVTFVCLRI